MSTGLTRRLTALEVFAEQCRRREFERVIHELARERGVDPERLMELYRECRTRTATLRARGLTQDQIEEEIARGVGLGVDELRAKHDAILDRFG